MKVPSTLSSFLIKVTLLPVFLIACLSPLVSAQDLNLHVTLSGPVVQRKDAPAPPHVSAMFEVDATGLSPKKGVLIPRMTTLERSFIPTPAVGLCIYNTDINCFQYYTGNSWVNMCGSNSTSGGVTNPCSAASGQATITTTTGTCGYTTSLSLAGFNGTIQWQQSNDGANFTDIAGATGSNVSIMVSEPVLYITAKVTNGTCAVSYSNVVIANATGCPAIACNTIGGTNTETSSSMIKTAQGGFALAGYVRPPSGGNEDFYVTNINADGTVAWTRSIGGAGNDNAYSIIQTTDGGFAVAGSTTSFGSGDVDLYVIKLDAAGNVVWSRTIGGTGTDFARAIVQNSDGSFTVAGTTRVLNTNNYDVYVVNLLANGTTNWEKIIGGTSEDQAYALIKTSDGGYAVAGYTKSFGIFPYSHVYVVKLTATGDITWTRTLGTTGGHIAFSIVQTSDGGYAVAGQASVSGNNDVYVAKLDPSGIVTWNKSIGGTGNEIAYALIQTTDGGYAVAGQTGSFGSGQAYLIKLDGSGAVSWTNAVGVGGASATAVHQTNLGFVISGTSMGYGSTDMYLVQLDPAGMACANCNSSTVVSTVGSAGTSGTGGVGTPITLNNIAAGSNTGNGGVKTNRCF